MRIELDREELLRAYTCVFVTSDDQSDVKNWVQLRSNGSFRNWTGVGGPYLLMKRGEADEREYQLMFSESQMTFMHAAAIEDIPVAVETDDHGSVVISTRHGSMIAPQKFGIFPFDGFDVSTVEIGASGDFPVSSLCTFVYSQLVTLGIRNGTPKNSVAQLSLAEGHIAIAVSNEFDGISRATLAGLGVTGEIEVSVDLNILYHLLIKFQKEETVQVGLPKYLEDPIVIRTDETVICLHPVKNDAMLAREHVEGVIEEIFGHLAVKRDEDGDYILRRHGHHIYGRLRADSNPVSIQIFGLLLHNIDSSHELLSEINQINSNSHFIKVTLEEKNVFVTDDLVAESLDAVELKTSVSKIAKALDDYGNTLSVVFGGVAEVDPAEVRWTQYQNTIVKAELHPEVLTDLNGASGVQEWPFPETVHVVSGWDPQGIEVDGNKVNSKIAADVMQMGGKFVLGAGVSANGEYSKPSLVVWGLDRDQMRDVARKASQDAIFELTAGEISLVSVYSDRVETFTRQSSIGDHHNPELE